MVRAILPQPAPKWAGINLETAENLKFGRTEQLMKEYKACLGSRVSPQIVSAWLLNSYQGERSEDGMPHGQGTAQIFGDMKYCGGFKGGLLHGEGTLIWADTSSYSGTFSYNCIHGTGKYSWQKGAEYTGQISMGLPHGEGSMYTGEDDYCTFTGFWKHGLRHGQGKLEYGKGKNAVYDGRWFNDRKHGEGNLTFQSGSSYKGQWSEGKRNGKGRMVLLNALPFGAGRLLDTSMLGRLDFANVHVYQGDWSNDLVHGRGKSVWTWDPKEESSNLLLNSYVGEYVDGKRHGQGNFYYASGAIYKGDWSENVKNGLGFYIYEDGVLRCGMFTNDGYCVTPYPGFNLKEPFEDLLEYDTDINATKKKISNAIMRHITPLRDVFSMYSSLIRGTRREHRVGLFGRSRGIYLEQFWQLLHDGNIVECGLGLAQIDRLLLPTKTSWDSCFQMHYPKRIFIFREFVECLVKIARLKYSAEESSLEDKVEKLFDLHIVPLTSGDIKETVCSICDSKVIHKVFEDNFAHLYKLFNETIREDGTSDATVKLRLLDRFVQRFKPQWGLQRDTLLSNLFQGLFRMDPRSDMNRNGLFDNEINYKEFQMALYLYSTNLQVSDSECKQENQLESFITEVIIPNLSLSLESLMDEDVIPSLPAINTRRGSNSNKPNTPRSMPGSKRNTPRESKTTQGAKSAPHTPVHKKK